MIPENKIAFLILPGFAPDNYPIIHLQDKLLSLGYHAVAMPFWGDAKFEKFSQLTIEKCKEGVASVISSLKEEHTLVVGIGISLGGALLIEHAKTHTDLHNIVSIGTPFKIKNIGLIKFLFILSPVIILFWGIGRKLGIKRMLPIGAARMAVSFMEVDFLKNLEKVTTPILILHSKRDMIADVSVVPSFTEKIGSKQKNIVYFESVGHTIGYDEGLDEEIIKEILEHFPNGF